MRVARPLLIVLTALCVSSTADANEKPNFLLLLTDDQTYEAVGALGLTEVRTPHLDRLFSQGTRFTHAYNMGGYHGAICVASRTMLNTGRSVWQAQVADNAMKQQRWDSPLWAERLQQAGYDTYFTGKWHVSKPAEEVFQVARNVRPGMPNQTEAGYNRPRPDRPDPWSPTNPEYGGYWTGGRHWSEVVADDAVSFLQLSQMSAAPFFMYVAFNAPHDPRQSPQEFLDQYPVSEIAVPENYLEQYPFHEQIGCGANLRDERLAPFPRTREAIQVHRREYWAIITHLDEQIGRILDALEETNQRENTVIFFTSDHGLACGRHGLLGKQNMFEHSLRVPLVVVGDHFPMDSDIHTPVYLQDIMPTSLELAGQKIPDEVAFKSLLPIVSGEREIQYEAIYGCYMDQQRMIVEQGYKLIAYPNVPTALLFDLQHDPLEMQNLADDPEQKPRMRKMFAQLQKLQQEMGDSLDLTATFPDLASK